MITCWNNLVVFLFSLVFPVFFFFTFIFILCSTLEQIKPDQASEPCCQCPFLLSCLSTVSYMHVHEVLHSKSKTLLNLLRGKTFSIKRKKNKKKLTCSTTIPARSRKISLRSEMDCTICWMSRSLSSTITVFCSTRASWSSVKP